MSGADVASSRRSSAPRGVDKSDCRERVSHEITTPGLPSLEPLSATTTSQSKERLLRANAFELLLEPRQAVTNGDHHADHRLDVLTLSDLAMTDCRK